MALAAGERLGPYEILAQIGAGGMGEVYKARDTRLERIVAIKVLSPRMSILPEARERFEREARTIANRQKMMVVDIQTQPTFSAGKPRMLFEGSYVANAATSAGAYFSVSPDGQRFLMDKNLEEEQATPLTQINVVQNWFEELNQKVPVGK